MRIRKYWASIAIVLLALASSAISIVNQFTYDDVYVIQKNRLVHDLHRWWQVFAIPYWPVEWGGDGYRPFTLLSFKLEWVIGHGSPVLFHAVSILAYAVCAVLVYRLAKLMLPASAAWLAGALFAVHPVHVEAVANVVGQSELLVALAVTLAVTIYLRDRLAGDLRPSSAVVVTALYAFATFSKEHGIVLPAILAVAEVTLIHDARPFVERARRLRPFYLALFAVALGFMAARSFVQVGPGIAGFQPYTPFSSLGISTRDRILTAITVVPQWIRLLFWPARLSSEYGPPGLEIAQGFSFTQIPGFMLLGAVLAFAVLLRRRQPVISFGIAVICIALLPSSNFILPAGIMLAERTLFLPSVGAVLMLGALSALAFEWLRARFGARRAPVFAASAACALLIAAAVGRSASRSTVWRDNDTLFRQAVLDAPFDYRTHFMLGTLLFDEKNRIAGEAEDRRALKLFPYDPGVSFNLAEAYRMAGMCEEALPLYKWTRDVMPDFPFGRTQYAACLMERGHYDLAKHWLIAAVAVGGDVSILHRLLVLADSAKRSDTLRASAVPDGRLGKVRESMQKTAP
jgi:protein O-mannosyl-transferase